MTKKDAWKQSIRAEVASALQSAHQPAPTASKPVTTTKKDTPQVSKSQPIDMTPIRQDLRRIGFVTGTLLVALVGITIAQHQTNFLINLYDKASQVINDQPTDQPQPESTADTSPVLNP